MTERRILLRGGLVLTMDAALGDFAPGDVLIEGRRIAAVGPSLDAPEAETIDASDRLVMPGLIDSHIHLWQTPLRGLAAEAWEAEYFALIHPLSGAYRAQDMRAATYGGALELLRNGATTVVDFCHSVNSPDFADASVDALRAAGIRALFAYSFRDRPEVAERAFRSHAERLADARRVREGPLAADDALVRMAIALNNIGHVDFPTTEAELACARELDVMATVHSYGFSDIAELDRRDLLGEDLQLVHGTMATDGELDALAQRGGTIASTPEIELAMEGLQPMSGRCLRLGIPTSVGVDVVSAVSGDLFAQMRLLLQAERLRASQDARTHGRLPDRAELTARQVLALATIDGARAVGLDGRTGSLTPGKEADVLVLSTAPFGPSLGDPAAHVVLQAGPRDVDRVFVAGEERVRDGELVDVDLASMRAALDEARAHIGAAAHDLARRRWDGRPATA